MALFGTDGIRGVANKDLAAEFVTRLGRAAALTLHPGTTGPTMLVARDTRVSGPMIEEALAAGVAGAGWHATLLGVVPTPAAAYMVRTRQVAAAAVISASHNPPQYNGIKFFDSTGAKISPADEAAIEAALAAPPAGDNDSPTGELGWIGHRDYERGGIDPYIVFLQRRLGDAAAGLHVVLDCGHGAMWDLAPRLFRRAGAKVTALHDTPCGARINVGCGSTNPQVVAQVVRAIGAQVGFTFDGDGDRCLAVDGNGQLVDGDRILAVTGLGRLARRALPEQALAATVMSNFGLELALQAAGGRVVRTSVGDRHVAAAMAANGLALGGEQSGHIIFADAGQSTGDGLLTAVELLREMAAAKAPLAELAAQMKSLPQVLHNVHVDDHYRVAASAAVQAAVAAAEASLAGAGRVLVRPSGTEPVVRVMVEGPDPHLIESTAQAVIRAVGVAANGLPA